MPRKNSMTGRLTGARKEDEMAALIERASAPYPDMLRERAI
jgi:hypothetical protein